jgi:hypothetical protein
MTRRCWLILSIVVVVSGLAVAVGALWPRAAVTAITRENAARIQEGMTLAEAKTILGGPATGQPTTRPWVTSPDPSGWTSRRNSDKDQRVWWCTDEIHVGITVDTNGQITSCHCWNVRDERLAEVLRRWLRL